MKESPLYPPSGIVAVLNTPFTADDRIETRGLRRHVDYALESGVHGFLVPALAAETGKLTQAERRDVVAAVLEAVNGRAPVIGSATAPTAQARHELGDWLIGAGCDGILAHIPYENAEQYRGEVHELAALQPPFLMLQDWDAAGYGLPLDMIASLHSEVTAFTALKIETQLAGPKYTEVLEATGGTLHVAGGWAAMQFIEALDRGVHAFMPTGLYRQYNAIRTYYQHGMREEAEMRFKELVTILAFSNQHLDVSIHFFKRLMHAQGIYATERVREPIRPFDAYHERRAAVLIQRILSWESDLR